MNTPSHPFLDPNPQIDWSALSHATIEADISLAIDQAKAAIAAIKALPPEARSYQNTFTALDQAVESVNLPWNKVHVLESLCDSKALRAAHRAVLPAVSAFFASIPLDAELYACLKSVGQPILDDPATLPVTRRHVQEALTDFEESGANLPTAQRQRLADIEQQLAEITKSFSDNVLDSTNAWERIVTDPALLSGLPDSFREAARLDALAKGHGSEQNPAFRFTLHAPSLAPALRFLDDFDLKKAIYQAYAAVGHYGDFENEPLILQILKLRHEKATILGKSRFADLVLSRRMARNADTALHFVEDLHARTKPAFDAENQALIAFRAQQTQSPPSPLFPWESTYWSEKLRKHRFDFDEEDLRPFFAIDNVLDGLFSLAESLFGVRIAPRPDASVWHPDVKAYALFDSTNPDTPIGLFYTDWFPRESKRGGAWMQPIFSASLDPANPSRQPHVGLIAGNFNKPVGDKPALLTHREVETVFHEFGHLLHHLLSEVPVKPLGGTNVAWDFVELPSQIMENWCWERLSLDRFARHFQSGDPIPEPLFQKLSNARCYGAARLQMRQLAFGKLDLALHTRTTFDDPDGLDAWVDAAIADYRDPSPVPPASIVRSFNHLFSSSVGYAAGYYSYKWAEVLDADAFTRFQKEGILSPEVGRAFRAAILAVGNSVPPDQAFRAFMHRDPDPNALLVRLGLHDSAR